jgi:hypothetical protein
MRPNAALIPIAALIAVAIAGWLVNSSGDDDTMEAVLASPTPDAVVAPPSPSPQPEPTAAVLRELPPAVWTKIEPEETAGAIDGNMFLLDLETGQLYSPTAQVMTWNHGASAYIGWAANGWLEVILQGFNDFLKGQQADYLGETRGPSRKLPSSGEAGNPSSISSTGVLAYGDGNRVVLLDVATGQQVSELPEMEGDVGEWSADGRYLSLVVSRFQSGAIRSDSHTTKIWDVERGAVIDEVEGEQVVWSNTSHRFLYVANAPGDAESGDFGLRLRDPDSGSEQTIDGALSGFVWSPDDRYVLISGGTRDTDDAAFKFTFSVYDVVEGRDLVTLKGAWAGAWLDAHTLGFTGNVCDTDDFYTINADGSNLRKVIEPGQPYVIELPSRQGDRVAYSLSNATGSVTTVVYDLVTGQTREYATGIARLPFYPGQGSARWSPDGHYLALHIPPGKGGPCEFDPPQKLGVEVH